MYNFKTENDKRLYELMMKAYENSYDSNVRMCTDYRGKNGYHSRLSDCTVHSVRRSFDYAYELLVRDKYGDRERAYDLLYRLIPLQDINPARDTYGIWQYFLEEDLEEMNPPDWNWADFNGKSMLRIMIEAGHAVTDDLKLRIKDSVYHACRAIIKRNVQPIYTNISIMGSYVTLVAGELYGWKDIFDYGKQRLQALRDYNVKNGNFSEFNSPCYTFVALFDLSDLETDVKDIHCKEMARELMDLAWATVAVHFHKATGQLAGPHFRAYDFLLPEGHKVSIERALDNKVSLVRDYSYFSAENILGASYRYSENLRCPEKYTEYFTGETKETVSDQTFAPSLMAYTYMNSDYTLGSISVSKLWNQHRNVLGYFGTLDAPIAFNLKCLHDGWDYCSCLSSNVQEKGAVLSALNFLTDAGDTHINLDMVKNATISAQDLRICWVFEGDMKYITVKNTDSSSFEVTDTRNGLTVKLGFPYAIVDGYDITFTAEKSENRLTLSAVIYSGVRKDINFGVMQKALIVTYAEVLTRGSVSERVFNCTADGEKLTADYGDIAVSAMLKPEKDKFQAGHIALFRNGQRLRPTY